MSVRSRQSRQRRGLAVGVAVAIDRPHAHALAQRRLAEDEIPSLPGPQVGGRQRDVRAGVLGQPRPQHFVQHVGRQDLLDVPRSGARAGPPPGPRPRTNPCGLSRATGSRCPGTRPCGRAPSAGRRRTGRAVARRARGAAGRRVSAGRGRIASRTGPALRVRPANGPAWAAPAWCAGARAAGTWPATGLATLRRRPTVWPARRSSPLCPHRPVRRRWPPPGRSRRWLSRTCFGLLSTPHTPCAVPSSK